MWRSYDNDNDSDDKATKNNKQYYGAEANIFKNIFFLKQNKEQVVVWSTVPIYTEYWYKPTIELTCKLIL